MQNFFKPYFDPEQNGVCVLGASLGSKAILDGPNTEARSPEQAAQIAAQMVQQGADVFFTPVIRKDNGLRRKGGNVQYSRCIALDLDVRPGNNLGPRTMEEAKTAIREHLRAGLPMPSRVVASGGGLHLYWWTEHTMSAEEWAAAAKVFAARLKAMAVDFPPEHALCGDLRRTKDGGFLRVAGSENHKYFPPAKVQVLHDDLKARYSVEALAGGAALPASIIPPKRSQDHPASVSPPTSAPASAPVSTPASTPSSDPMAQPLAVPQQPWTADDLLTACPLMALRRELGRPDIRQHPLAWVDNYDWWLLTGQVLAYATGADGKEKSRDGLEKWAELSRMLGPGGKDYIAEAGGEPIWRTTVLEPKYSDLCTNMNAPCDCATYSAAAFDYMGPQQVAAFKPKTCGACPHNGKQVSMNSVAMLACKARMMKEIKDKQSNVVPLRPTAGEDSTGAQFTVTASGDDDTPSHLVQELHDIEQDATIQKHAQDIQALVQAPVTEISRAAAQPFFDWVHNRGQGRSILGGTAELDPATNNVKVIPNGGGAPVHITRRPLAPLFLSAEGETVFFGLQKNPADTALVVISIPMQALTSGSQFSTCALSRYVSVSANRAAHRSILRELYLEYIASAREESEDRAFGIVQDKATKGWSYVCGEYKQAADGTMLMAYNDQELVEIANTTRVGKTQGDPAKQLALLRFYWRHAHDYVKWYVAASLGAMLRPITVNMAGEDADIGGSIVNLYGDARSGKSHVMALCCRWFGGANSTVSAESTMKGMMKAMGAFGRMPVFIDEFSMVSEDALGALAYSITGEAPRVVSNREGTGIHAARLPFKSLVLTNSNTAYFMFRAATPEDEAKFEAQRRRVTDINLANHRTLLNIPEMDPIYGELEDWAMANYGWVGPWFGNLVTRNISSLRKALVKELARLRRTAKDNMENFWLITEACTNVAANMLGVLGIWEQAADGDVMSFIAKIGQRIREENVDAVLEAKYDPAGTIQQTVGAIMMAGGRGGKGGATRAKYSQVLSGNYPVMSLDPTALVVLDDPQAVSPQASEAIVIAKEEVHRTIQRMTRRGSGDIVSHTKAFESAARKAGLLVNEGNFVLPGMRADTGTVPCYVIINAEVGRQVSGVPAQSASPKP